MASVEETIEHAKSMAKHYEDQAQSLIDQYGTGVLTKPGFRAVLAIAHQRAKSYADLAALLKEEDSE